MLAAIAYSDNIYAVKTHMFFGEENLVNMSSRLGISTKLDAVPSLPLGTYEINIIEMAAAYATFANFGVKSAIRDMARLLKIPSDEVDYICKTLSNNPKSINDAISSIASGSSGNVLLSIHALSGVICLPIPLS